MSRFQVLTNVQWLLIQPILPRPTDRPGRKVSDARTMVEAIVYRYRTGIAWRDLPGSFGPWQTVWTWHQHMATDGTCDRLQARLTAAADAAGLVDWSLSVDSTIARRINTRRTPPASQGAGSSYKNLREEPPDHGIGRRGGLSTKIHQLVDGNGLPLVTRITPGQAGDSPMFFSLMAHLRVGRVTDRPRTRPDAVRGDKAYSSRAIRGHLRTRGIRPSSLSPMTRRATAYAADHEAAGLLGSTRPATRTAT